MVFSDRYPVERRKNKLDIYIKEDNLFLRKLSNSLDLLASEKASIEIMIDVKRYQLLA